MKIKVPQGYSSHVGKLTLHEQDKHEKRSTFARRQYEAFVEPSEDGVPCRVQGCCVLHVREQG